MSTYRSFITLATALAITCATAQEESALPAGDRFSFTTWKTKVEKWADPLEGYDPKGDEKSEASKDPATTQYRLLMPGVLNIMMAKEVSQYLSSSGDLSYARAFATLDDSDDRLTLAYNFTNKHFREQAASARLKWVYSVGIKGNIAKGFADIWNQKGFAQDIGLFGKITWVGRGSVRYFANGAMVTQQPRALAAAPERLDHQRIAKRKEVYYKRLLDAEAKEFLEKMGKEMTDRSLDDQGVDKSGISYGREFKDSYRAKIAELQASLAKSMIAAVYGDTLYTWVSGRWVTLETYLPVTEKGYNVAATAEQGWFDERLAMPFSVSLGLTGFARHPSIGTFQGKVSGRVWQNNSVDAGKTEEIPFQTIAARGGTDSLQSVTSSDDVNIGTFSRFATGSIALRGVYLYPCLVGISAEVEQVLGDVNALNWKLGVPFRLQDKDGNASVNVEVQWREQYKQHSIGLSIGLPIGKSLYE